MPGVLDENVVVLKFDNSDFEKNTKQSMETLEQMKQSFRDSESAEQFDKIGKAAKNVDLSGLEAGVEKLNKRFSTFGIIGTQAINNLTNYAMNSTKRIITAIPNQIIQGGWKRALNIEQAKFQIEGLKLAWDETSEAFKKGSSTIKENVLDAVNGTAYGLDEAAKVAAQFAASGMKAGKEMTNALKGISGVAAMSGSSFEDIGRIFTQVSGQGRLMGDQLLQLSSRGMNAAATLAKYLHKSEAEVREMVSKGQIDFKTFAEAMNDAFGEHAKKANDTYTGSLANMKAALSRIGADVEARKLENMRNIFNALTPVIDQIHVLLGGVIERINGMSTAVSNFAVKGINAVEFALKPYVDAIKGEVTELSYLDRVREHAYQKLSKNQKKATKGMVATQKQAKIAWDIINGGYSEKKKERKAEIEALGEDYAHVQRYVNALIKAGLDEDACHIKVAGSAKKHGKATEQMGESAKHAANKVGLLKPMVAIVGGLANMVNAAKAGFNGLRKVLTVVGEAAYKVIQPFIAKGATKFFNFSKKIADSAKDFEKFGKALTTSKVGKEFKKAYGDVAPRALKFKETVHDLYLTTKDRISGLDKFLSEFRQKLAQSDKLKEFSKAMAKLKDSFGQLAHTKLGSVREELNKIIGIFKEKATVDNAVKYFENLASKITKFINGLTTGISPLQKFTKMFVDLEGKLTGMNMVQFNFGANSKAFNSLKKGIMGGVLKSAEMIQKADVPGILNKTAGSVQNLTDVVGNGAKQIDFKGIGSNVLGFIKNVDWKRVSEIGKNITMMVAMIKVVRDLGNVANATVGMLGSISGFFRSLSGVANQIKTSLKVEVFRTVAMSIAMIAGSIAILAMVPKDRLGPALAGVTAIMAMMVGLAQYTSSNKFDPARVKALGVSFAGMGAAMLSLAFAAEKIAKLSGAELAKAGFTIGGFIAIFVLAGNATKQVVQSGKTFALMAAAIDGLIFAMNALAAMKVETILKGGFAIMYLMTELAIASRIAGNGGTFGLLAMAMAIDVLLPAIIAFGMMPVEMILKGGTAVVALVKGLALAARFSRGSVKDLLALSTVIGTLAISLTILSLLDSSSLAVAMTALVSSLAAVAAASHVAEKAKKGVLAIAGVIAILTAALVVLIKMDIAKSVAAAASLSALALALAGSMTLFSKINPAGALKGLASLSITVSGIIALMSVLGGLNKLMNGAMVKGINAFGDVLEAIGEAFGRFTGGFISGMSSGLPNAARNLTDFMLQIQPFLLLAKDIKAGSLKGVKNLSEVLMNLSMIDFSQIAEQGKLDAFGDSLQTMALEFTKFSTVLGTIPKDTIQKTNTISKIIKTFTEIANSIPSEGGFKEKLVGVRDLSDFAGEIKQSVATLVGVLDSLSDVTIDKGSVKKMANIGKIISTLGKVSEDIPASFGALQGILGNTTLSEFAQYLADFAPNFGSFITATSTITIDDSVMTKVDSICKVITKMVEAGSKIPPSAGLQQFVKGNTTLSEFAWNMVNFIPRFSLFMQRISMIPDDVFAATSKIPEVAKGIAWMGWAAEKIPTSGGIKGAIKGIHNLGTFSEQLTTFIPNYVTFLSKISNVKVGKGEVKKIQNIGKSLTSIAELSNSLKSSGGLKGKIFGDKDLGKFAEGFSSLAEGVKTAAQKMEGVNTKTIESKMKDIQKAAKSAGKISVVPKATNLVTMAKNVASFAKKVNGAATDGLGSKTNSVVKAVENIVKAAKKASASTSSLKAFGDAGKKAASNYVKGLKSQNKSAHSAGDDLSDKASSGMKSGSSGSYNIGSNVGQGFVNGINAKKSAAYSAGYALGKAAIQGKKDATKQNSPSKEAIKVGKGVGEGFVMGMDAYNKKVYKKGYAMGQESLKGQKAGIQHEIDDISRPVITPVIDDSSIRRGIRQINNAYSSQKAMSIRPQVRTGLGELVNSINDFTKRDTPQPTINNISVKVEGSENPEAFATRFVRQLELEMRTGYYG